MSTLGTRNISHPWPQAVLRVPVPLVHAGIVALVGNGTSFRKENLGKAEAEEEMTKSKEKE